MLERQLNHILEQFSALSELETDDIAATAQVIALDGVLRDDAVRPSLSVEEALSNAPERSGDHFVVPAVIDATQRD